MSAVSHVVSLREHLETKVEHEAYVSVNNVKFEAISGRLNIGLGIAIAIQFLTVVAIGVVSILLRK